MFAILNLEYHISAYASGDTDFYKTCIQQARDTKLADLKKSCSGGGDLCQAQIDALDSSLITDCKNKAFPPVVNKLAADTNVEGVSIPGARSQASPSMAPEITSGDSPTPPRRPPSSSSVDLSWGQLDKRLQQKIGNPIESHSTRTIDVGEVVPGPLSM